MQTACTIKYRAVFKFRLNLRLHKHLFDELNINQSID